jgi:hypothetical protein
MTRKSLRGAACIEFAFVVLVGVPLLLGMGAVGINMIRTLQTIQLARDAGHMYARNVDFSQAGNKVILANLGSNLGLSTTPGSGTAVVILSTLTYVDNAACTAAGAVDVHGNPSGCTNLGKWVFTQRLTIGNSSIRSSNMGSPLVSGPTGVTVDATTGRISIQEYVTRAGAVAQFNSANNGINPYSVVNGVVSGLPSGQVLYLAEAGATGFTMPPFVGVQATYSYGLF